MKQLENAFIKEENFTAWKINFVPMITSYRPQYNRIKLN